ncbi:FitA-like ribbon-helix-helix domain-containing protein [Glycomyces paridis]
MTDSEARERAMSIRAIPATVYERLRRQAAAHQRSMEAEARDIIDKGTRSAESEPGMLGSRVHRLFAEVGGFDEFAVPPRTDRPRDVDFSEWS